MVSLNPRPPNIGLRAAVEGFWAPGRLEKLKSAAMAFGGRGGQQQGDSEKPRSAKKDPKARGLRGSLRTQLPDADFYEPAAGLFQNS